MDEMNVLETNEPNSVQTIIKVTFDGNIYSVTADKGVSYAEIAFAVSVVARVLERDGVATVSEFMQKIRDYIDDPQWEEVIEPDTEDVE